MKNPKGIVSGVAIVVVGLGIMGLSAHDSIMDSIGGGLFLIGITLLSYFLIYELKK